MTRPIDRCAHCGEPESAHHEFEAVTCRCAEERGGHLRPASHGHYLTVQGYEHCVVCGHDRGCHAKLEELTDGK